MKPKLTFFQTHKISGYNCQVAVWVLMTAFFWSGNVNAKVEYPDLKKPGPARAQVRADGGIIENDLVALTFAVKEGQLRPIDLTAKNTVGRLDWKDRDFFVLFTDAGPVRCSELRIEKGPKVFNLPAEPDAQKLARHFPGKKIMAELSSPKGNLRVDWSLILRDGSNYIHQEITLRVLKYDTGLGAIRLIDGLAHNNARMAGTVAGSPVVVNNWFMAYEHPNSKSEIKEEPAGQNSDKTIKRIYCSLERNTRLKTNQPLTQSSVMGVVPEGQLRRGFLYYVERERGHPYRPFLHYNSWYDIAWADRKMNETQCLDVIKGFGENLIRKRGVKLDSFVFDDGWDDNRTLWQFHQANFPDGFTSLKNQARKYDSALGTWLSPWGGYGEAKRQRVKFAREQGFETNRRGLSLAGTKYYKQFLQCCRDMIDKYGVNFFKFDGIGTSNDASGASTEDIADIEALMKLTGDLRKAKPDLFISVTVGTWPSVYWLWYGDSIWRSGGDMGFFGKGSRREQWITYRDKETYQNVVKRAPLYPINSLMLCGINNGKLGTGSDLAVFGEDFVHEVRSFFGSGTNLQELYITHSRMTDKGWDVLAEAAKWSHAHADVLVDAHWIGGNPGKNEIYGWASWSRRKGILVLRNPYDQPQKITIDIGKAFNLPRYGARKYALKSPWQEDADQLAIEISVGGGHTFEMKPFEVLVFDALPR